MQHQSQRCRGRGKAHRKTSSFFSFFRKNRKLIDSIFFIVRVQFSMIHKKSNTKECKKRVASKESIACKGFQPLDGGRTNKLLRICVLQAQRTCLTACYICYSSASSQTVNEDVILKTSLHLLKPHLFRKIFAITHPASNILQSKQIDLLIAVRLVETAEGRLPRMRNKGVSSRHKLSSKTCQEKEEGE